MLKTGTGSLKDIFNNKYTDKVDKDEANVKSKHGRFVKYSISHKSKVDIISYVQNLCDICDNGEYATTVCIECKQHLCSTCSPRHRNMRSSISHHLVNLNAEYELKTSVEVCSKHSKHEKLLFCLECSEEICLFCKLLYHVNHATKDLVDATDEKSTYSSRQLETDEKTPYQETRMETNFKAELNTEQLIVNVTGSSAFLIPATETGNDLDLLRRGIYDEDCESDSNTMSLDSGNIICRHVCHPFF